MILTKEQITEKLRASDKPDNITPEEWKDYKANGLGPCMALMGRDYCGKPAWGGVYDMKEITKPGDAVVNYKMIAIGYLCPAHIREPVYINADGTVTHGKSSYGITG